MRFQILQNRPEDPFQFELLSNAGDVLLTSDTYNTQDACTAAIQDTIDVLGNTLQYDIQNDASVALRSASGAIVARSNPQGSQQQAASLIASIVESAGQTARYDVTLTRTRRRRTGNALRSLQRMSDEELLALYNFARLSRSGRPGFELFEHDDEQFYFHFNDDDGRALLYSRGFPTAAKRDRRIESVIQNAGIEKRYEIREQDGQYAVILKARNSQEIARSRLFSTRDQAVQAILLFRDRIPPLADRYVKKRRARSQAGGNVYNFAQVSTSNRPGFETLRNAENKQHYFHFNDDDGRALLYSQGYSSTKSRDNGVLSVIKNSATRDRYEAKEDDGRYYFILRAGNRQEIARSRSFASAADRDRMIATIMAAIPAYAAQYGIQLESTTETQTERFTLAAPPPPAPVFEDAETGGDGAVDPVLAPVGAVEEERSGVRLWTWLLPLLLLLLLLALLPFLLRQCNDLPPEGFADTGTTENATPPPADLDPPAAVAPEEADGSGSTGVVEAEPEPFGPNAAALGFVPGSLEARIADLLSDPNRELPVSFVLDKLRYLSQSHAINKEALPQIDNLAKLLLAYPDIRFDFQGHIDARENDNPINLAGNGKRIALSTIRARCVFVRLLGKNVGEDQVGYEGFGTTNPVASNDSETDRQKNRRLEFVVKVK